MKKQFHSNLPAYNFLNVNFDNHSYSIHYTPCLLPQSAFPWNSLCFCGIFTALFTLLRYLKKNKTKKHKLQSKKVLATSTIPPPTQFFCRRSKVTVALWGYLISCSLCRNYMYFSDRMGVFCTGTTKSGKEVVVVELMIFFFSTCMNIII